MTAERDNLQKSIIELTVEEAQRKLEKQAVLDAKTELEQKKTENAGIAQKLAVAEERLKALDSLQNRYDTLDEKFDQTASQLADARADLVGLRTTDEAQKNQINSLIGQNKEFEAESRQQAGELREYRARETQFNTELLMLQKELQQSEREREQLSQSLAVASSRAEATTKATSENEEEDNKN